MPNTMIEPFQLVLIHGITDKWLRSGESSLTSSFFSAKFPNASISEFQFSNTRHGEATESDFQEQARFVIEKLSTPSSSWGSDGAFVGQAAADEDHGRQPPEHELQLPLILFGHDLGGCLLKEILVVASREPKYKALQRRLKGVAFAGTPHSGANASSWENHIIRLLASSELECGSSWQLLQNLPQVLHNGAQDFAEKYWGFPMMNIFQQTAALSWRGSSLGPGMMLLSESSAKLEPEAFETYTQVDSHILAIKPRSDGVKNIAVGCSHAQLWILDPENSQTERICKELCEMLRTETTLDAVTLTQSIHLVNCHLQNFRLQMFLEYLARIAPESRFSVTARPSIDFVDSALDDNAYKAWNVGTIHVSGPSESDASALATSLLKQNLRHATVISFRFDRFDIRARTHASAFISLTRQLLLALPRLFRYVQPLCKFILERRLFNKNVFWALLRSLLTHCNQDVAVYCIIYALQDCDAHADDMTTMIRGLNDIAQVSQGSVKIILTSNDCFAPTQSPFCPCQTGTCRSITTVDEAKTTSAAPRLVQRNVARIAQKRKLWAMHETRIVETFSASPASDSIKMSRLAALESANIRSTWKELRAHLETPQINAGDSSELRDIGLNYDPWVTCTFRWAKHAMRPLDVAEAAVAVACEEKQRLIPKWPVDPSTEDEPLRDLVPLDLMDDLTKTVPFLFKFDRKRVVLDELGPSDVLFDDDQSPQDPQYTIFSTCLGYLRYLAFRRLNYQTLDLFPDHLHDPELALLNYAVTYWPNHYKLVALSYKARAARVLDDFLDDEPVLRFWAEHDSKRIDASSGAGQSLTPLRLEVICRFGLYNEETEKLRETISTLIPEKPENTVARQKNLGIVLDHAAQFDQPGLVQVLLELGADSARALGLAAARGNSGVAAALLKHNPSALQWQDEEGYTALHHAVCSGDCKTLANLIDDAGVVDVRDAATLEGSSALALASRTGHLSAVTQLLNHGAVIHCTDQEGYDALELAVQGGYYDVVDLLLSKDADFRRTGMDGDAAVHLATRFDHPAILKRLLECEPNLAQQLNDEGLNALQIAAAEGHVEVLQILLNAQQGSGRDIDLLIHTDEKEETKQQSPLVVQVEVPQAPFQLAAMMQRIEVVQILLVNQGHAMKECSFALFLAVRAGLDDVTNLLLSHGSRTDICNESGHNLVHQAVQSGNPEVLELVIQNLKDPKTMIDKPDASGWTPLHMAAETGSLAMVNRLLAHGADVNVCLTEKNETPLHLAARGGHLHVVNALIEGHDDTEKKASNGKTALDFAIQGGHAEVVKVLIPLRKAKDSPFHSIEILKHERILKALLDCKEQFMWNVNGQSNEALHLAAKLGSLTTVRLLVEAGAKLEARDGDGETPLSLGVTKKSEEVVHYLLEKGAGPGIANAHGDQPLHIAATDGNTRMIQLLLTSGTDINARDKLGRTPLYRACLAEKVEAVETLLENEPLADVNCATKREWVPLHAAATHKHGSITNLLLRAGANPRHKTRATGLIPFARACFSDRRLEVVQCYLGYLDTHRDLLNIANNEGETAVHRAVIGKSKRILSELIKRRADLNAQRRDGNTPLQLAVSSSQAEIAQELLNNGVDVSLHSHSGETVLMSAAKTGQERIAEMIMDKAKVDVNERCENEYECYTALVAAASHGQLEMVKWLLDHDADPNLAGGRYGSPLSAALNDEIHLERLSTNRHQIVRVLVSNGADASYVSRNGKSVVQMAVSHDLANTVKFLLGQGARMNQGTGQKDSNQGPLIFSYIGKGEVSMFKALLEDKDQLSVRDRFGRHALSSTIDEKQHDMVQHLLSRQARDFDIGADKHDHAGRTPLMICVLNRLKEPLQKLLEENPKSLDSQDFEGKTALAHACILDFNPGVDELLSAGANPAMVDFRGRSPLYWACRRASKPLFQKLLEATKETANKSNSIDFSAECAAIIPAAILSNRPSFLEVLLAENANVMTADGAARDGWAPLFTARMCRLPSIIEMMKLRFEESDTPPKRVCYPTSWSHIDKTPRLDVNGTTITVGDSALTPGDNWRFATQASVRADFPMIPIAELGNVYYFEVTIESNPEPSHWCIGFSEEYSRLNLALGWEEGSWGWHGDDGLTFNDNMETAFGEPYGENDTIGCGVDFDNNSAFFTRNGKVIGQAFEKTSIKGKLYPAVSVHQDMVGAKAVAQFWRGQAETNFAYKIGKSVDPKTRMPSKRNQSVIEASKKWIMKLNSRKSGRGGVEEK